MKRQAHFLETLLCILIFVFFAGRIAFFVYNRQIEDFTFWDVLHSCKTGLMAQDFGVSVLLLALPWLLTSIAARFKNFPLKAVLIPYYIILGIVVGVIIVADTIMYEFWQFKLKAVILSYAAHPEGATSSVSVWFIVSRVIAFLAVALAVIVPCIWLTPKRIEKPQDRQYIKMSSIIWVFFIAVSFFYVRMEEAYRPDRSLFVNHATVNPVYAFFSSFRTEKTFAERYDYLDENEREQAFKDLYPADMNDITDTLLHTKRPDVLVIFMESLGGTFVEELGGFPNVTPNLSRLIPEGIFWENYYSNSFRTDRGTASLLSGNVSYPEVSLMTAKDMHGKLPSLAKTFNRNGYSSSYLYAGPMTNMGKRTYLENCEFQHLLDYTAFTPEELTSTWGADDEISAMKVYSLLAQKDSTDKPLFFVYQTISSHEPWIVPYHRLEDKVLNAFAYTDECVGKLVDSLKTQPIWDNLLVIILPDHGHLYKQSYEDPLFFHSPMLWLGGAIRQPKRIEAFMNQSDIAATLFSQLGIAHDDFPWSRNVLSKNYTHPFAYCNFPGGVLWADNTGTSIYDITANQFISGDDSCGQLRVQKAKAVLQTSHDMLDNLK